MGFYRQEYWSGLPFPPPEWTRSKGDAFTYSEESSREAVGMFTGTETIVRVIFQSQATLVIPVWWVSFWKSPSKLLIGLTRWRSVKESACQCRGCRRCKRCGFNPWVSNSTSEYYLKVLTLWRELPTPDLWPDLTAGWMVTLPTSTRSPQQLGCRAVLRASPTPAPYSCCDGSHSCSRGQPCPPVHYSSSRGPTTTGGHT